MIRGSSPSSSPLHCWWFTSLHSSSGGPRAEPSTHYPYPSPRRAPHPRIPGTQGYMLAWGHVMQCSRPIQGFPTQLFPRIQSLKTLPRPKGRGLSLILSQCASRDECIRKDEEITKPMATGLGTKFTPRLHIIQGFK